VPLAPFVRFSALWVQVTGSWCNLECTHCFNASGPRDPWLRPLDARSVRAAIAEAEALGVREIYYTGGEPFLHPEILPLIERALEVASTTVLTNGTAITERTADRLAALAQRAAYSLELRVSLDDPEPEANDQVRGRGAWGRAVAALRRLHARGLLPIVTATEIVDDPAADRYARFRRFLLELGIDRPRVKILPVLPMGRLEGRSAELLDEAQLDGFDRGQLYCAESRALAEGGVYACPILAGLPGARMSAGRLAEAFRPAPLYHPACVTCHRTGLVCRNA
jgi:MoaA/NifB/PqqE/SkfB family radical SAM enzyme